jgi:hypothetical protein
MDRRNAKTGSSHHGQAPELVVVLMTLPPAAIFICMWLFVLSDVEQTSTTKPLNGVDPPGAKPSPCPLKRTAAIVPWICIDETLSSDGGTCSFVTVVAPGLDSAMTAPALVLQALPNVSLELPLAELLQNWTGALRWTAAMRAVLSAPIRAFAVDVSRLELMAVVKLGTAITSRMAATAMATISSTRVKPLAHFPGARCSKTCMKFPQYLDLVYVLGLFQPVITAHEPGHFRQVAGFFRQAG